MADIIEIGRFAHLFEIGVLVNGAYGLMAGKLASPTGNFVKLERKVRSRLKKLAKSENPDLMADKKRILAAARGSETVLGYLERLSMVTVHAAALVCLLFLVAIGYSEPTLPKTYLGVILFLVLVPVPLSRLSLRAMAAFSAMRIEGAVMGLALRLRVLDDIQKQAGRASRTKLLKIAMEIIEPAFEQGVPDDEDHDRR